MKRLSKIVILILMASFATQTLPAQFRSYSMPIRKPQQTLFGSTVSGLINKATAWCSNPYNVMAGVGALLGISYCAHKLYEWLHPFDESLLEKPNRCYEIKPKNLMGLYVLFMGNTAHPQKKSKKKQLQIKGAATEDRAIIMTCFEHAEAQDYLRRQENIATFSRVGTIDISQVQDMSDQDKKLFGQLAQEAVENFCALINAQKFEKEPFPPKYTALQKQLFYDLAQIHGKMRALIEMRLTLLANPGFIDVQKGIAIEQDHAYFKELLASKHHKLFKLSSTDNNQLPELSHQSWCHPELTERLGTVLTQYEDFYSRYKRDKKYDHLAGLGTRHGYMLGCFEVLKQESVPVLK